MQKVFCDRCGAEIKPSLRISNPLEVEQGKYYFSCYIKEKGTDRPVDLCPRCFAEILRDIVSTKWKEVFDNLLKATEQKMPDLPRWGMEHKEKEESHEPNAD